MVYDVSISQAIEEAKVRLDKPASWIMRVGSILAILILIIDISLWWVAPIVFIAAIIICQIHRLIALPKWKVWAYSNVRNVHQLQRTAELSGILPMGGGPSASHLFAGSGLTEQLGELLHRFEEDNVFEDDPSIPETTVIYRKKRILPFEDNSLAANEGKGPIIVLSNAGIESVQAGFISWAQISDEHVALKDMSRRGERGEAWFLAYIYPGGSEAIYLRDLAITVPQVDLLLWLYRGRYETGIRSDSETTGIFV